MLSLADVFNRSDSTVPLSFGGASISGEGGGYGFGPIDETTALKLLQESFDSGIKIYDTAPIYGYGLSEKRIGKCFQQKRDQVFIVSKCGVHWHSNRRVNMTNDPKIAEQMFYQSLKDLHSDYIDLYMIHWPDHKIDIRKTYEVLAQAKAKGYIRYLGLCNTHPEDLKKAQEIEPVDVVQSELNFFNSQVTTDLFPSLKENKIHFMSWGTLDKGILSGSVQTNRIYAQEDCRSWAPWWKARPNVQRIQVAQELQKVLHPEGYTLLEFALGFNLSYSEVSSAICGFRNSEQLCSALKALKHLPTSEVLQKVISTIQSVFKNESDA